jgi:hypothetical protein
MTWIPTLPFNDNERLQQAQQALRAMYPIEYAEPTHPHHKETDGVIGSHSLIPDAMYHAFAAFAVVMSPDLPLSRRQHEMITTVVSAVNRCQY